MKKSVLGILLIFLAGCSPIFYVPNSHNIPMFTEQGQGEFGFGGSLLLPSNEVSGLNSSFELQTGYALFQNVAFQFNYMHVGSAYEPTGLYPNFRRLNYNYFEGAVGYFKGLSNEIVFEGYSGIGIGNIKNQVDKYYSNANYTKLFLQPSISYKSANVRVALASRLIHLSYSNFSNNVPIIDYDKLGLNDIGKSYWLIEPSLSFSFNIKMVKIEWQWLLANNLDGKILPKYNFAGSFGISYLLSKDKKSPNSN